MRFRKLRFAWSVACGIACVLVFILWMRSYRWHESVSSRYVWPTYVAVPLTLLRPYNTDPGLIYHSSGSPVDYRAYPLWITWNAVSRRGQLTLTLHRTPPRDGYKDRMKELVYAQLERWPFINDERRATGFAGYGTGFAGFGYISYENYRSYALGLTVPHWFAMFALGALAAAPWIPWSRRFSLRTLLITMTLIAVALGLVIYTARKKPEIEKMPTQIEKTPDAFDAHTGKRRY
jgi:hypothetical protein